MSPPWMPIYIADYRADTAHLCAAEHGAYLLLIMHYWQTGGLPEDDRALARIASMTPQEWRRHRPVLQAFFHDGWRHKRIDDELRSAATKYERRAGAGSKGGKAAAGRRQSSSNAIDIATTNAGGNAGSNGVAKKSLPPGPPIPPQPQPQPQSQPANSEQGAAREASGNAAGALAKRVVGLFEDANNPNLPDTSRLSLWLEQGYSEAAIIAVVSEGLRKNPNVRGLKYFEAALAETRSKPPPEAKPQRSEADIARANLRYWVGTNPDLPHDRNWPGEFNDRWGGPPGSARCRIPAEILAEFGVAPMAAPAPGNEQAA